MRSQLPTLELDAVFEAKEEVAVDVKNSLTEIMTTYGYQIVQVCRFSLTVAVEMQTLRGRLVSYSTNGISKRSAIVANRSSLQI